eukprot:Sspe_Gene.22907::Locus_8800_Transcript_1_1_Confidence_1.000_Length_927::g.22907::m.22907
MCTRQDTIDEKAPLVKADPYPLVKEGGIIVKPEQLKCAQLFSPLFTREDSMDEIFRGRKLLGVIKSFNEDTGFGFIRCTQTHKMFKRDVFLHKAQAMGLAIGQQVEFEVELNVNKMPQARNVVASGDLPATPGPIIGSQGRTQAVKTGQPASQPLMQPKPVPIAQPVQQVCIPVARTVSIPSMPLHLGSMSKLSSAAAVANSPHTILLQ